MGYKLNPFTGKFDEVDTTAAAGSDTQVQFNDSGKLGGSADLTWDDTGKVLGIGGDIDLDDGGTYTTTLQVIGQAANVTITHPAATGMSLVVSGPSTLAAYAGVDGGFYGSLPYSIGNGRLEFSNALGYNPENGTFSCKALAAQSLALGTYGQDGAITGATTIAMSSTLTGGTTATFSTGYNIGTSVELRADAVNTLAQFRTTSAQTYRLYNAFTSATNFERGKLAWERSTSDATTNGFITATTLTVDSGISIAAGQIVTGTGVLPGTRIISGSGLTWVVSQSQTVGTTGARVAMVFGAPALRLGTEKGSAGGTAQALELQTDDTTRVTIAADGSKATFTGNVDLASTKVYKINNTQVVAARVTSWGAPTGTATRTTFATYAGQDVGVIYVEAEVQAIDDHVKVLSQRLKALIDDLTTHGLIGA